METIKLTREGFQDMYIRQTERGWEYLEYTDRYGHKKWKAIPFAENEIQDNIKKYKSD